MAGTRAWRAVALGLAAVVMLAGCKSHASTTGGGEAPGQPEPSIDANGPWTKEQAAASIGEAAAVAAKKPAPDRAAIIDAAVEAAVDQAMLVAPDLAADQRWVDAIRAEIGAGVVQSSSLASVVVDAQVVHERVRTRTLDWLGGH